MMTTELWQPARQQAVFRQLMNAMAYPGRVFELQAVTPGDAARAVLACLLDGHVSLCDCHGLLESADWPLLAANQAQPEEADYLLCDGTRPPAWQPRLGSLTDPDASATLVIRVDDLLQGAPRLRLAGPGVPDNQLLCARGLHPDWLAQRAGWVADFPLGVDLILADPSRIAAVPRSSRLEVD